MVRINIPSDIMTEFESAWKNNHEDEYFHKRNRTQMVIRCVLGYINDKKLNKNGRKKRYKNKC